jgi:predicted transcriptional regulator
MTTYGVIPLGSPTFIMLMAIGRAGKTGLAIEDFNSIVTEDMFINSRIQELIQENHIVESNGLYYITPKGINFLAIFTRIKKILNKVDSGG